MDTHELIDGLRERTAYPHPVDHVDVIQTHASIVFLAQDHVYKLKKPKNFGFLDYSTLERRHRFCHAEVELNRRLAPDVYLGVVPIHVHEDGLRVGEGGPPIDYAVHMRRLSDTQTLAARIADGSVTAQHVRAVAECIAAFHRQRTPDAQAARWSTPTYVRSNFDDNFAALDTALPELVGDTTAARLRLLRDSVFASISEEVAARHAATWACDGHGDLRTDHVYVASTGVGDVQITIVDCIEFDERYRCGDPIADIAFLAMDLRAHGAWKLADDLLTHYLDKSGDPASSSLLAFYCGYRAMVRAKVEYIRARLPEVQASDRAQAQLAARKHLMLTLGELAPANQRPGLVLVGGLPASGKSTLAGELSETEGFEWIRADIVRKQLFGVDPDTSAAAGVNAGIYTDAHSHRTYQACLARARTALCNGRRVIVDATFVSTARRSAFFELAQELGVPALFLICRTSDAITRSRLVARTSGPSDADIRVYQAMRSRWEPPRENLCAHTIDTSERLDTSCRLARQLLRENGL